MMKKAKLMESRVDGFAGDARWYKLSEPAYDPWDQREKYNNIIISRNNTYDRGDETMAFPATEDGKLFSWSDLFSGLRISHEDLLLINGFEAE